MKVLIKKLLRESLEGLTPDDLDKINQIVDREVIQNTNQKKELENELNTEKEILNNIINLVNSGKFSDISSDAISNIKQQKEDRINQLQQYLERIDNFNRDDVFKRISNKYLNNKKYEEERLKARESRTFNREDIITLFVTALEGGSNYWYELRHLPNEIKYKTNQMGISISEAIGEHILEGGYIQFYDAEEDYNTDDYQEEYSDKGLLGTVDINSILEAITIIKKDYPDVWERILDEQEDANDADIFLQLCVMGEVTFG